MLTLSGTGEPAILGEYPGLDAAGVVGPDDSATSERSFSLARPGGRAGIGNSSDEGLGTGCVGGVGVGRCNPSDGKSMSTAW